MQGKTQEKVVIVTIPTATCSFFTHRKKMLLCSTPCDISHKLINFRRLGIRMAFIHAPSNHCRTMYIIVKCCNLSSSVCRQCDYLDFESYIDPVVAPPKMVFYMYIIPRYAQCNFGLKNVILVLVCCRAYASQMHFKPVTLNNPWPSDTVVPSWRSMPAYLSQNLLTTHFMAYLYPQLLTQNPENIQFNFDRENIRLALRMFNAALRKRFSALLEAGAVVVVWHYFPTDWPHLDTHDDRFNMRVRNSFIHPYVLFE